MRVHLRAATAAPKLQRCRLYGALGQRQRKAAMQRVAGAERIDGADPEYRHLPHGAALHEKNVAGSVTDREEGTGVPRDGLQRVSQVEPPGGRRQTFGGKDHVRRDAKQRIVRRRRLVGIEHHAHIAPPRRLADRPHELRNAVVGEHDVG